jgi:hypothetical protein
MPTRRHHFLRLLAAACLGLGMVAAHAQGGDEALARGLIVRLK